MIKNVLVVCTGNSCRSVMGEWLLKDIFEKEGMSDIHVSSAGTMAGMLWGPTQETIEVMKKRGIDVSEYKSRPINKELIEQADIILVMTGGHKKDILKTDSSAENKTKLLKEFHDLPEDSLDIVDPIGQNIDFYQKCLEEIEKCLFGFVKWLKTRDEG
jgi:protein-tyrosine-phosphatase